MWKDYIEYEGSDLELVIDPENGKEILNLTNHDLMPNCVASFHKELVNDALKYSNLSYIYNKI